jgi:hypothetical protein
MNLSFDTSSDKFPLFGTIDNMFFNKVNPTKAGNVLKIDPNSGFKSEYPLINEISIDRKPFYIFSSNWDPSYYRRYNDKSLFVPIIGTENILESKSFLGSKIMSIPNEILIDTFNSISSINIININNLNFDNNHIVYDRTNNLLTLDVYLEKRILSKFIELEGDKFMKRFLPEGLTATQSVSDYIKEYFKINVLKRYRIQTIRLQILESNSEILLSNSNITDQQRSNLGYTRKEEYRFSNVRNSPFDFQLIYNLNTSSFLNFSFGLSVDIIKK